MELILFIIIGVIGLGAGLFSYWQLSRTHLHLADRQAEINRRMYELAILKELGDRIGYSLDVHQIIDIITSSLHQFIHYSTVSYMILEPDKILFKIHLEQSVHRQFIDDVKNRMLSSLSALLDRNFDRTPVSEVISGAILLEGVYQPVQSFFNIPIVIGGVVQGVLTVAHIQPGLYREDEMTILYRIMQQAATAVSKLQEVVRNEERKLNAMVQSISEGVVMTDNDYRVVVANQAAKTAVGITDKKEITIFDFIDNLGGKFDIRGRLEESLKFDKIVSVPDVLIGDRFFEIIVAPVKASIGEKSEVLGGVVIFHDITHEKEVEKLKEDFSSMMVHELRSPLDGIKKRIEVLREKENAGQHDEKFADDLTKAIYENASHMLELVNDLLDAAKLESGKFDLHKQEGDITNLLKERLDFYQVLAKDAGLSLELQLGQALPAALNFDPMRLEQVLNNLLSNSIKFTESGGKITIQAFNHTFGQSAILEAVQEGIHWQLADEKSNLSQIPSSVIISVTDTGVGIAVKDIPRMFNKFQQFRASAVQKNKSGTGLGLVIAKGIIESHGGVIGVASKEGSGTTVYFTIPLV